MALDPCDGHKAEGIWNDPCCPHCPVPTRGTRIGRFVVPTPPGFSHGGQQFRREELESKPFPSMAFLGEPDRFPAEPGWNCIGCDLEFDITPDHPAPDVHICGVCKTKRPDQFTDAQNLALWTAVRDNALKKLDTD